MGLEVVRGLFGRFNEISDILHQTLTIYNNPLYSEREHCDPFFTLPLMFPY